MLCLQGLNRKEIELQQFNITMGEVAASAAGEINSLPVTPRSGAMTPGMAVTPKSGAMTMTPRSGATTPGTAVTPRSGALTPIMAVTPRSAAMAPLPPRPAHDARTTPPISAPPSQFHSPSLSRSPLLLETPIHTSSATPTSKTPRSRALTPRFITPLASPVRKIIKMTKLKPLHDDEWLPITESRNGNAYYAAFHTLCSGIGIQALILPVAFTILGWTWGITSLTLAFIWQMYTLWLLVQLHESPDGTRYSRYLDLFVAAFGKKLGTFLGAAPIMYLSAGTCTALIIIGGSTMKLIYQILCGPTCSNPKPLTTVEWYLVFTCIAVVFSQLPSLNSIAGVSLVGAITAVGYCTLMWVVSVAKGRIPGVSYNPAVANSDMARVFGALNALGIIAFAFRGHNLVLEIQATMPSSEKYPSRVPMWRGVKLAYVLIALCLFPLSIGGYWAYGHMIPTNGGMLTAVFAFHSQDTSKTILVVTGLFVVINAVSSFQIYGMPTFDSMEMEYTSRFHKACPWWVRSGSRLFFGFVSFFIAVALPFLGSIAGLIGGLALPTTLAYPCFMWVAIKKPKPYGAMWYLNWGLGILGITLSLLLICAGLYSVVETGIKVSFFNPK